jgi:hypothetical protein
MKRKGPAFPIPALAFLCTLSYGAIALGSHMETESPAPLQQQPVEKREYIADDGRTVVITSLGNLIGFESPRGFEQVAGVLDDPIDGYVLAYRDPQTGATRVLHNVYRSQSSTIEPGLNDFVPISFQGPASKTVFPSGKPVHAEVVVGTRDGLVQIRTAYSWMGGIVRAESLVTSMSQSIRVLAFKRQTRHPLSGGVYGALGPEVDVLPVEPEEPLVGPSVVISAALCCRRGCDPGVCPPRLPEFSEAAVNTHSVLFQAGPDALAPRAPKPSYLTVADAEDPCERLSAGQCQGKELPRFNQDSLVTAGWLVNRTLRQGRSLRFVTRTTVF